MRHGAGLRGVRVKRIRHFSFSDVQAPSSSTVVASCTHFFFSFLALVHFLYPKYSFFFFLVPFLFSQWLHSVSPPAATVAMRESALGFIACLPCGLVRRPGKQLAFVLNY